MVFLTLLKRGNAMDILAIFVRIVVVILQTADLIFRGEICLWLTKKPKSDAARELRELACYLSKVDTHDEAQLWIRAFVDWHSKHKEYINERSIDEQTGRWWYTHKMLHRSASHIMRAIPNMFNYTRYQNVPKTSNSIESFFGHLKTICDCIADFQMSISKTL